MRERPIIFSGESVRAILDGRKTQTRRVIKPQPDECFWNRPGTCQFLAVDDRDSAERIVLRPRCPYGVPGDRLWVRETWREVGSAMMADNSIPMDPCECRYRADDPTDGPWRSPRYMPRWASRITLEVIGVRVERVQDITRSDIRAEGATIPAHMSNEESYKKAYLRAWVALWDSVNAKRGYPWAANPWVLCVTFRKLEGE